MDVEKKNSQLCQIKRTTQGKTVPGCRVNITCSAINYTKKVDGYCQQQYPSTITNKQKN